MVLSREISAQIREVLEKHPEGLSITDLVGFVDINRNTAGRYLENLLLSGQVEMRRFGMAKLYTLAKRLPASSVLSISSELVMQLDSSLRLIYANEPLLTFLGIPAKDLFGKNIEFTQFSVVFEELFPELLDRFRRGLKGEEWYGELAVPVQQRFFFCRIAPTVSSEGSKGVSVLLEDISDQKRDAERIRKSEARLRSIFKVSPVGIGLVKDRVFLEVNDRFCEMTGYSPAELVGRSVRMLYPSEKTYEEVGDRYHRQIRGSGTGSVETRWIRKDGTVTDVILNVTPLDPDNISGGLTFAAMDITERKHAELAVRESEEKFRSFVETSPDMIWEVDLQGRIRYCSPRVAAILGYTPEEITGRPITDLVPDEVKPLVMQEISRAASQKGSISPLEVPARHRDGKEIILEIRPAPAGTDRNPEGFRGVAVDITERKRGERALQESESKLQLALSGSEMGMWEIEIPSLKGSIDKRAAGILGMKVGDIGAYKADWDALSHPDDVPLIHQRLIDHIEGRAVLFESEHRMRHESGSWIWVLGRGKITHRSADGSCTRISGTIQDITARKQAEEALKESEDRYRKLVEISPDAVILHQDQKIIYVNPAAVRVLGARDSSELTGRRILEFIHPDYRDAVRDNIEKDLAGEQTPAVELQMLRTDGTPVMVEGRGVSTSIAGVPAVMVAVNDITERYRASLALKESEKRYRTLAEASRDFIFLISRDDRVEYVNSYAAAVQGAPADEIIGKKRSSLFPGELGERQAQALHRVFETGKAGHSEGPMEVSGILHWFDHYLMPITNPNGVVTYVLGVSRDITGRKKAEDALRESEDRYRYLLGQTFDAIAVHQDKKIAFLNERAAEILGAASPQELIGRPIFDLIHPDSCRDLADRIRMMNADPSQPAPVLREKFFRVDGTTVTVDVMALRITKNGLPAIQVMFRQVPSPGEK